MHWLFDCFFQRTTKFAIGVATVFLASASVYGVNQDLPRNVFERTQEPQKLQYIHSGIASLAKRLEMIESAKKTIEVEFYIYNTDLVGRLITQALVKKAQEGVKVRLLVDSAPFVRSLDAFYATVMAEYGIEVRFYNDSMLLDIQKVMHRSHRKALIVDGETAITGGRNISEEYFDLSPKYNFLDRDVFVEGTLVKAIQGSFYDFWQTRVSQAPEMETQPQIQEYGFENEKQARRDQHSSEVDRQSYRRYKSDLSRFLHGMEQTRNYLKTTEEEIILLGKIKTEGQRILSQTYTGICHDTYFIADYPGWKKDSRVLYHHLSKFISSAKAKVVVETPYFILTEKDNLFARVLDQGVGLEVLTNSLFSSDNSMAIATFYPRVQGLVEKGAAVHVYDGRPPTWYGYPQAGRDRTSSRWGIHSKSAVIDDDISMISTFNIDPRSKDINAEMAVVCRGNRELAQSLKDDMELRKTQMIQLDLKGEPVDGRDKYFGTSAGKKFLFHLTSPLAHIIDFWL